MSRELRRSGASQEVICGRGVEAMIFPAVRDGLPKTVATIICITARPVNDRTCSAVEEVGVGARFPSSLTSPARVPPQAAKLLRSE
jgi:hypothetical protein